MCVVSEQLLQRVPDELAVVVTLWTQELLLPVPEDSGSNLINSMSVYLLFACLLAYLKTFKSMPLPKVLAREDLISIP